MEAQQVKLNIPKRTLTKAIKDGAIFYCSHSGGKDSACMYWYLRRIGVPDAQIVVVHANLGRVEHAGVIAHIRANIDHELHVVRAVDRNGQEHDLLEMVRRRYRLNPDRPPWPSSSVRYCTSDLKRGPIEKFIRQHMKRRGALLAVNCIGLRAAESRARARRNPWTENKRLSKAGRQVADWLPIHHVSDQMLRTYRGYPDAAPLHPVYAEGNDRLSCAFCIFGCKGDLRNAARLYPELLAEYLAVEQETGFTMFNGESLADRILDDQDDEPEPDSPHQGELF
jgi:3'-phosphoadenosine 5'-phosphosulfate sulfotransferase (PAPS reductase)/FAD synthetase